MKTRSQSRPSSSFPFGLSLRASARTVAFMLLMAWAFPLFGATYYVDFGGGDDQADGLTPRTAWKHSPGDRNATDTPGSVELQPGDTVVLRGGVQYFGEIEWRVSGSEEQPIVLDGNTGGTFGEGRAILDGARMITDWKSCESAEQVLGNPRWKEILYADLDADLSSNFGQERFVGHRDAGEAHQAPWQRLFLIDGERRVLPIAQTPKPSDPFYPDIPSDFYQSPHKVSNDYPHKVYYEGCADILFEGNYVHNTVAINRNAERLVFRNNVIDGQGRTAVAVAMWTSGHVGGRQIKDLHFFQNTLVNTNRDIGWATGILGQRRGSPGSPEGLIIRNNILDGLAEDISGEIENNIYTREVEERFMGPGCKVVSDPNVLFRDPAGGDYRRKPGGPAMNAGASIPPPGEPSR